MGTFVVVLMVAVAAGMAVLTMLGFRPARPLAHFVPDRAAAPRLFADDPIRVQSAYAVATERTPGMRVIDNVAGLLYVDSRPTSRIIGGDFGVTLRIGFRSDGNGTAVHIESQGKVGSTRSATLRELERALRMRAKTAGLSEYVM